MNSPNMSIPEKTADTDIHVAFVDLIREICTEEKIKLEVLSNGWLKKLTRSRQTRYIFGYKFALNPQSSSLVADDKFATYDVLKNANLPVIEHRLLYENTNNEPYAKGYTSYDYIKDCLEKFGSHVIIKPNNGTLGRGVVEVTKADEIEKKLPIVFEYSESASICPFYEITKKYRLVVLDGEIAFSYRRKEDGKFHTGTNQKAGARTELFDTTSTPIGENLTSLAKAAANAMNLRFCSVDFIETSNKDTHILEVNSGVMLTRYLSNHPEDRQRVKSLYRKAILKMFTK